MGTVYVKASRRAKAYTRRGATRKQKVLHLYNKANKKAEELIYANWKGPYSSRRARSLGRVLKARNKYQRLAGMY